jgi:hypothetical protein
LSKNECGKDLFLIQTQPRPEYSGNCGEKAEGAPGGAPLQNPDINRPLRDYWIALPTLENTLFAFDPMSRTVPTTITRITASITAYSAIS